jgi:hypothetical protein
MVILALILKRARIKASVKDKRSTEEAFGTYVEVTSCCLPYAYASTIYMLLICCNLLFYGCLRSEASYIKKKTRILLIYLSYFVGKSSFWLICSAWLVTWKISPS